MLGYMALGVLALPLLEIAAFIKVGSAIGVLPTLVAVLATSALGAFVLRRQGLALGGQIREAMRLNQMPGKTLFDAMAVFGAGFLLLVPGFVTDALGLILLLPPVRHWLYGRISRTVTVASTAGAAPRQQRPQVIELDSDDYRRN